MLRNTPTPLTPILLRQKGSGYALKIKHNLNEFNFRKFYCTQSRKFFLTQRHGVSQSFFLLILQNAIKIILCAKLCALCVSV